MFFFWHHFLECPAVIQFWEKFSSSTTAFFVITEGKCITAEAPGQSLLVSSNLRMNFHSLFYTWMQELQHNLFVVFQMLIWYSMPVKYLVCDFRAKLCTRFDELCCSYWSGYEIRLVYIVSGNTRFGLSGLFLLAAPSSAVISLIVCTLFEYCLNRAQGCLCKFVWCVISLKNPRFEVVNYLSLQVSLFEAVVNCLSLQVSLFEAVVNCLSLQDSAGAACYLT